MTHDQWVEDDHIKECIASGITDVLLQEIKLNALQSFQGFRKHTSRDYRSFDRYGYASFTCGL